MAKKKVKYIATANKYLKYAGEYKAIGDKFEVAKKDVEELKQHATIEEVEIVPESSQGEGQENADGKEEGEEGDK